MVIGGGGEKRTLRIAARWADQWNAPGASPDVLAHKIAVLHRHCADVGRDPGEIEVSVQVRSGEPPAVADEAAALIAAGAQHVIVGFRAPFDAGRLEPIAHALESISKT
jgi:alkanesulfonate monooxygenase SsuD/methylene tetrahydromethanopterin reductase-like flavin-dependent oxidoreductase (luciferase family)